MNRGRGVYVFQIIIATGFYFLSAKLGLSMASFSNTSPVWPASGIGVGILAFCGPRSWPAIFLGAFFANVLSSASLQTASIIAVGNLLEGLAAYYLIEYLYFNNGAPVPQKKIFSFLLASVFPPAVSASVGLLALKLGGQLNEVPLDQVWVTWWVGDSLGILALVPLIYRLGLKEKLSIKPVETLLFFLATVSLAICLFGVNTNGGLLFLFYPLLLLVGHRLGELILKLSALVICSIGILFTINGHGPFGLGTLNYGLVTLQLFLAGILLSVLVITSLRRLESLRYAEYALLTCWFMTALSAQLFQQAEKRKLTKEFDVLTEKAIDSILEKYFAYENALRASVGFMNGSAEINRQEWKNFVSSLGILERYPGVLGIGVVYPVGFAQEEKFLKKVRSLGVPDFRIHSVLNKEDQENFSPSERFVITFVEPLRQNQQAQGLDVASEKFRYLAASDARDTGRAFITKKITLVQDLESKPGSLFFLPFYDPGKNVSTIEERRRAFKGLVYAPFTHEEFFKNSLLSSIAELEAKIYLGETSSAKNLVFTNSHDTSSPSFSKIRTVTMGGQTFIIHWNASAAFSKNISTLWAWISLIGSILSLLVGSLMVGFQNIYRQAEDIAAEKTALLKESESTIRNINRELELKIQERTATLEKAYEELKQSESSFREMADSMPQIVWWANEKGENQYFNKRWFDLLGLEDKKTASEQTWKIMHPEDQKLVEDQWETSYGNGLPFEARLRLWDSRSSEYRWHLTRTVPVRDQHGKVKRWYGTTTDIHDQMDLIGREQAARESSRLKSEFLANMSHEVRTPLNIILGLTTLMESTPLTPQQQDYVLNLKRSGQSLKNLVSDILDFSKIEAGHLEVDASALDFHEMLKEITESFKAEARLKNLDLSLRLSAETPERIIGDEAKLRQVLSNLISNALKFSSTGKITIDTALDVTGGPRPKILVSITDQGIGLSQESIGRLFTPFTQADASTSRRFGGTGLGLSICKKFIEKMDGEIGVRSTIGEGSTFWFTVPHRSPPSEKVVETQQENLSDLLGARILLAEDNEMNALITKKFLENQRCQVTVAENGNVALDLLRQNGSDFDLILMDCQMPVLDGYKTTQMIREDEEFVDRKHIPIIALSANAFKNDKDRCLSIGMNAYLSKPVSSAELAKAVKKELWGTETLDAKSIERLRRFDGGNLLKDVLTIFIDQVGNFSKKLEHSYGDGRTEDLRRDAHAMKASALNVGARYLGFLCLVIERSNKEKDPEIAETIRLIQSESIKVIATLRTLYLN